MIYLLLFTLTKVRQNPYYLVTVKLKEDCPQAQFDYFSKAHQKRIRNAVPTENNL